MKNPTTNLSKTNGFTLVELLTVIAIIGVLAAILVPVVGKVRESAGETAGRAQFSQWGQAFELFRQDYGFYPDFSAAATGNPPTATEVLINNNPERFYEALTGRKANSPTDRIESANQGYQAGNIRAASYYTFGEGEVETDGTFRIVDRFGNEEIVVLFDRNQDGVIKLSGTNSDYSFGNGSLPAVTSARTGAQFDTEIRNRFPTDGVRASVIFYSAGYGNRPLLSWE